MKDNYFFSQSKELDKNYSHYYNKEMLATS